MAEVTTAATMSDSCSNRPHMIMRYCLKHGVALTGCNTTGPPSHAVLGVLHCAAVECYRRRQTTTTTDASEQNNTALLYNVLESQ